MNYSCLFCSLLALPQHHTEPEDEILAESEHFYMKPALGSFVEGYSLIISKEHEESLALVEENALEDFAMFKGTISEILVRLYGRPVVTFEHGTINRMVCSGSCIDHAHAHLIPSTVDADHLIRARFKFRTIQHPREIAEHGVNYESYLFHESTIGNMYLFELDESIPSQYQRQIICEVMGIPDVWDWRTHPFHEQIDAFKKAFKLYQRQ